MSVTLRTSSPEATRALGQRLGRLLAYGDVVLLHGDLGSGKTTLAQGILTGLGVTGPAPSPTFTLIHEYQGETAAGDALRVYHLDLYRLRDEADFESIGLNDYLAPDNGISLIEWPERAASYFDGTYLLIEIMPAGADRRRLRLSAMPPDASRFAWLGSFA